MSEPTGDPVAALRTLFFPRPEAQLAVLPLEYRWEALRRHPYYLVFWEAASRYYSNLPTDDEVERALRYVGAAMVRAAGAGNCIVDPAKSFSELDSEPLHPAWSSGAVQPPTVRTLVTALLNVLPPAERAVIGAILQTSGHEENRIPEDNPLRTLQRDRALQSLSDIHSPVLDSFIDVPLVYIHTSASQNTILRDVEETVRYWKQRRKTDEVRIRAETLKEYLQVWDLREGWTGGDYDQSRECTFPEIAKKLRRSKSTVYSGYRRAFALVTGYEFAPNIWQLLFLRLKFTRDGAADHLSRHVRRQMVPRTNRPVPESVLSPRSESSEQPTFVASSAMVGSSVPETEKHLDILTLLEAGSSDREIIDQLELAPEELDLVRYVRQRMKEFQVP